MALASGVICHYCKLAVADSSDHIVPKSLGGSNREFNRVGACRPCNSTKGTLFPDCRCAHCVGAVSAWAKAISPDVAEELDALIARCAERRHEIELQKARNEERWRRLLIAKGEVILSGEG